MYILTFKTVEDLRREMLRFHELARNSEINSEREAGTLRQREFHRGRQMTHATMKEFWKHVHLEIIPSKP